MIVHKFLPSLFRCVFYLPVVTGSVAVTVVWKWMYNNYYGIFNYLGKAVGLIDKNINWLGDERFALGCIILILLTTSVGQPIVLAIQENIRIIPGLRYRLLRGGRIGGNRRLFRVLWVIRLFRFFIKENTSSERDDFLSS